MSQLPGRPSLAHLRKQAKELLHRLRQEQPESTLADAQHALARQYGFASWPKLKVAVTSLATLPTPVTFHRYTLKAKEALFFSRYEARQLGSRTIEPEHVVLGLMRVSQTLKHKLIDPTLSIQRARLEFWPDRSAATPLSSVERAPLSAAAARVFQAAVEEADAGHYQNVGVAHLLIGVLCDADSDASRLLTRAGMSLDWVRENITLLLNDDIGA